MSFPGHVEARFTVPASTTVSASTGAHSSAVTVTVPADNYYLTEAGGVDSILDTLETELNENVQPYAQSAAALASQVGFGAWDAAWLCNESSGDLAAVFGAPTLTDSGTPTYGLAGFKGGIDKAIGFAAGSHHFDGSTNFDVTGTDDLVVAAVINWTGDGAASRSVYSKIAAAFGSGWAIQTNSTTTLRFSCQVSGGATVESGAITVPAAGWYALLAVIDRTANVIRIGIQSLTSGTQTLSTTSAVGSSNFTTAATFRVGGSAWVATAPSNIYTSYLAIAHGASAAGSLGSSFATALTNFAAAINGDWVVSNSTTTGRTTIAHESLGASVEFTSTALRDLLGYEYDVDYPQTAAELSDALGYGDFTTGANSLGAAWLCNESSGDLAPVFGSVTLADTNTPTYGHLGPRGSTDKAVAFDHSGENFDGLDNFDVSGTQDLIVVWVGRFSATPSTTALCTKWGAGASWNVLIGSTGPHFMTADGATSPTTTEVSAYVGEWHVGIAVLDRSTGMQRIATYGLLSNTASVSAEVTAAANSLGNSGGVTIGSSYSGTGASTLLQYAYLAIGAGTSVATGLSANLSTAISNFASYMRGQTSTQSAHGVWIPNSPLTCDDHPSMAPEESDLRTSESPTGHTLGLSGNIKYAHHSVGWERVDVSRIREASADYPNQSLEVFFRDAFTGTGHSWFTPCSPMQVYWSNAGTDALLGEDANDGDGVAGWWPSGVAKFSELAKPSQANWVGQFTVRIPRLCSNG